MTEREKQDYNKADSAVPSKRAKMEDPVTVSGNGKYYMY